jgi:hypothetical protein
VDRGMYVCRTLSFKGAEFSIGEVPLESKMQVGSQALFFVFNLCVVGSISQNLIDQIR